MKSTIKINKSFNYSEIARIAGFTPQYVHMLLKGDRNNPEAIAKIQSVIKEILAKAA